MLVIPGGFIIIYCISHFEPIMWFDKLCGFLSFLASNYDLVPRLDSLCVSIYLIISCLGKVRLCLDAMCVLCVGQPWPMCSLSEPPFWPGMSWKPFVSWYFNNEGYTEGEINFKFVKFYKSGLNLIFKSMNQFHFNRDVPVFFGHLYL